MAAEDVNKGTGELFNGMTGDPLASYNSFRNLKQFIRLEKSFKSQLENDPGIFGNQNTYVLQENMKISAEALLDCMPEKISLRVTDEGSIFYTVIKGDLKIYLQHFLINEFDDTDEAIISIFQGNDNLLNYAGELAEVINQLGNFFSPKNIQIRQMA